MKILYGMQRPDEGTHRRRRRGASLPQPERRHRRRHRHGAPALHARRQPHRPREHRPRRRAAPAGSPSTSRTARRQRIARARRDATGCAVDPDALVETLGVGERQRVEILKVLYRGARILILDEPTAVLVPQEVDELFANLRELKREGITVIFISHKLDEVLGGRRRHHRHPGRHHGRHGRARATSTAGELAELMVGSELPTPETARVDGHRRRSSSRSTASTVPIAGRPRPPRRRRPRGPPGRGRRHRRRRGQRPDRAASRRILGLRRADDRARSRWAARTSPSWSTPRSRRDAGIGYIPEDRHRHGLLLDAPLWENRCSATRARRPYATGPRGSTGAAPAGAPSEIVERVRRAHAGHRRGRRRAVRRQPAEADRRPRDDWPSPRVLHRRPPDPRRRRRRAGGDLGPAPRGPRRRAWRCCSISADLEELIGLSDTLLVMLAGRIVADARPAPRSRPQELGSLHDRRDRRRATRHDRR